MTAPQATGTIQVAHDPKPAADRCPWCDQAIPHERFERITERLAAAERTRSAEIERRLRDSIAREKMQIEARATAAIEQAKSLAAATLLKERSEAAAREAKVAADARAAAEAVLTPRIVQAQKAAQDSERTLATMRETNSKVLEERLQQQREALEKAATAQVNAERAKGFKEKLSLEANLKAMQRRLEQRTAAERGEGAEIDLFEALRAEFPGDRITRVGKGVAGADILHEVTHNGRVAGLIIYDSKDRAAWRNDYVTKLRADQLAAKADHAILSTQVFRLGARQVDLQEGVIVANPARVVILATLMRNQIVQADTARLSNEEREEKASLLYEYVTSEHVSQLFKQLETVTGELLVLDVAEQNAHGRVWRQRGELIRSAQKAQATITLDIEHILSAAGTPRSA